MRAADDIAARRDLDPAWVRNALGEARHLPGVARLMQPPAKGFVKNWRVYRSRFIDPVRIGAGVRFWQANLWQSEDSVWLRRIRYVLGKPPEHVVELHGDAALPALVTVKSR